jgi:uncharacterized protein YbjT (DUF2867 family)
MYPITGITGKVGGVLARALLAESRYVRAVLRDAGKGRAWAELRCEVALADMEDAGALTAAFKDADGVFILPPSEFDPTPGFPEARAVIAAVKSALEAARPRKIVCLSTIGAQATQPNLLTQRTLMEQAFAGADDPRDLPAASLVYGELCLGRRLGARPRRHRELPATARQAGADDRDGGYRSGRGEADPGRLARKPCRRAGSTAAHHTERSRRHLRSDSRPHRPCGNRPPRDVGRPIQVPGNEES